MNLKSIISKRLLKDGSKLKESWDWESEIKKASDEIDKERGKKTRVAPVSDDWISSRSTQVTDRSFADRPIGVRHKGTYGTSYVEPDEDEKEPKKVEPTSNGPKKRGRPVGAVGAAKRAAAAYGNDGGKLLQDILIGKISSRIPSKFTRKVKGYAQSGSPNESVEHLEEMTIGSKKSASGKKVVWVSYPGIGHSVTVDGNPVHKGFVDHKTAAALYVKHLSI